MELRYSAIGVALREQDPSQRVVGIGTSRCELNDLLECLAGADEIGTFQVRQTILVEFLGLGGVSCLTGDGSCTGQA